ncbi:MAG: hypothetical protein B7C24_11015 [Bacteroidetes bacterium 4572_77]|nr:MAG: hypothetical protein B7C24_11015 [Bacteroidetes bacterium 4572_77]
MALLLFWNAQSQENKDSLKVIESKKEILFFSNDGCGKCATSQQYFEDHDMPYTKYAIKTNRPLMYKYVHKKTGGKNVGVGYPLIVYGDSIYFSITKLSATLKEIQLMMLKDGVISAPKE